MTTLEILGHFRARGLRVIETRDGATVTCPAHDDAHPSLHLTTGRDGRTLGVCRAGCRAEEWTRAAGLNLGDLFVERRPAARRPRRRSPLDAARAEAVALAHRQAWARPDVLEHYAAADAIRAADRSRRRFTAPTDDEEVWDQLAAVADLTMLAENILAGAGA
jgi:hypothetical protein